MLVQDLKEVKDSEEAKKRGFPQNKPFKLLTFDFVLATEAETHAELARRAQENARDVGAERLRADKAT